MLDKYDVKLKQSFEFATLNLKTILYIANIANVQI